MTEDINAQYAAHSPDSAPLSEDSLTLLKAMAQLQLDRIRECERVEEMLKRSLAALHEIQCQKLPTLMSEVGVPRFDFVDSLTGERFVVENPDVTWRVSMPGAKHPEKRQAIYTWLREIGQGLIIKKTVEFPMGKLDDDKVKSFIATVQGHFPNMEAGINDKVEPSTLSRLIRGLKKEGKNVHEDLSIEEVREVKVTPK